jgi:redox-sensitive bicupin YhaK (pirin superfamily)
MIRLRPAAERGHFDHGWLDTFHTFSFGGYRDSEHMGFRDLRVINEDRVAPGKGFGTHPHADMEILTYIVAGALEHEDSMGNGSVIRPGDVQRMSAGTGVTHSEFNASTDEPVHLLQIWILPERRGIEPSYEEKHFAAEERRGRLCLLASRDGREESVSLHQDVDLYGTLLEKGQEVAHELRPGRHAWVQVVAGSIDLGDTALGAGDGAAVSDESRIVLAAGAETELLLFDLA